MLSLSRRTLLALALFPGAALASCRAFPVGLYVPYEVLDGLAGSQYVERLDEARLAREVQGLCSTPIEPARGEDTGFYRLDQQPILGPLACQAFDACGGPATSALRPGDLLLVKNGRPQNLGSKLTLAEFTFYDHLGVLTERDGRWFVCDSWPSFHPFGKADDFADRFRGGVRATPLPRFLGHYETLLVVRLPDEARNAALAEAALASLDEGIEYDPHHDPRDPRLSCSEYLLLLLERVGHPVPSAPRPVVPHEDLLALLSALGFPTDGFFVPEQFAELPGACVVGWISRHRTRAGARAIEVALALLHERFLQGDRVADFLGVDRFHLLRYRDNVELFLRWAEGWAEARGLEDRQALERELRRLLPLFFIPRSSGSSLGL